MKILISLNKYEINLLLFCFQNVREKPCPNAGSWNALENTKSFTQLSPGVCPLSESEVTYGQVCQVPILGICALHLTYSKCTHTAVNTHLEQWAAIYAAAPEEVPCSSAPQSWYWGWRERCTFTPSTYNPCRTGDSNSQPLGHESDSLPLGHDFSIKKHEETHGLSSSAHPTSMNLLTGRTWRLCMEECFQIHCQVFFNIIQIKSKKKKKKSEWVKMKWNERPRW